MLDHAATIDREAVGAAALELGLWCTIDLDTIKLGLPVNSLGFIVIPLRVPKGLAVLPIDGDDVRAHASWLRPWSEPWRKETAEAAQRKGETVDRASLGS